MAKKAAKTTKTTTASKASKTQSRAVTKPEKIEAQEKIFNQKAPRFGFRIKRSYVIWGALVLLAVALIYGVKNLIIAATVNGQPISRIAVVKELERQGGKQALNALVTKTLILQEAKKQNVSVNQDEINKELKKIEENIKKQGQTLDQALTLQGMTREQLVEQIRLQKMIEKIVGKDIKVSDKEVTDYIKKNQDALPQEPDPKKQQDLVREQLRQQKLNEKVNTWIEDLRKNAKIQSFVPYYP